MRAQWDSRNANRHGHIMAVIHAIRHAQLRQAITVYHSELAGWFGIVLAVTHLILWAEIKLGGIKIGCDVLSLH
jgi:hypothetical protein